METLINSKVIFNPLSKMLMTTSQIPVCDYWSNHSNVDPINWRNQMVSTFGDEIISNGGELSVQDNGDIIITRNTEEVYPNQDQSDSLIEKDWYFNNISLTERDLMSDFEWDNYVQKIKVQILRRYMTEEEQNLIYTDINAYQAKLKDIEDNTAYVEVSIESTLWNWLESAFGDQLDLISSTLIKKVFKLIKIRQLSISAFTDIRTWMFGISKNFYPFCYFKWNGIQDMIHLGNAPTKLSDISFGSYSPGNKSVFWKEITSTKKHLMTVCKWTNTDYYALPEGWFKAWQYSAPVNSEFIGNKDGLFENVTIEYINHGSSIDYNVYIDSGVATDNLTKVFKRWVSQEWAPGKDPYWFPGKEYKIVGTQEWKSSTSQSKFLTDYGFTVPVTRMQVQNQRIIKFEEGDKFCAYWCFYKNEGTTEKQYFDSVSEEWSALAFVGTTKLWTTRSMEGSDKESMRLQPLVEKKDFSNEIKELKKEMWNRQDYYYDETYINDGYTKGNFYYMTSSVQTNSSGFIGLTCQIKINFPYEACFDGVKVTFHNKRKYITLRSVMAIHDMNDTYQIKDTINQTRFEMLSKLYSYITMFMQKWLVLKQDPPTGIDVDERMRMLILYGAIRECMTDVDYYEKKVLFNDILTNKEKTLFDVFAKTFRIDNEKIEYFTDLHDAYNSDYVYELKTFAGAQQNNQSYTNNNTIRLVPTAMPFDVRDFTKEEFTITFNALIPSISSDYDMGGGFIGKMEYRLMQREILKYIVCRSKEFKSGLSNSEVVRFDIDTFNTEGLDALYENAFPTTRKDINIVLRRITEDKESDYWQSVFLSNTLITNLVYDHNWLTETDMIKLGITVYERETS